jgi:FlaA1/EpsC-like NDP-sugar epimerase
VIINRAHVIQGLTLTHDMLVSGLALTAGLYLRLGVDAQNYVFTQQFLIDLLIFIGLTGVVSIFVGLNRGLWRYASLSDLFAIVKCATLVLLLYLLIDFMVSRLDGVPRTALITTWALMVLMMSGTRVMYRAYRNHRVQRHTENTRRTAILVGAGSNAELFLKAVSELSEMQFRVVGVYDERNRRSGMQLRGIPVVSNTQELNKIADRAARDGHPLDCIVVTKRYNTMDDEGLNRVIEWSASRSCEVLHAQNLQNLSDATAEAIRPAQLRIEDLLERDPAHLDTQALTALVNRSTVCVTGAGGSIGSEMCRQIMRYGPRRLVLIDLNEFNLYKIEQDLAELSKDVEITPLLGDVRDRDGLRRIFERCKPDLVFHAAALKHVPIVERQPLAGLRTNTLGTRNVAKAAIECGARAMVLISTDKAVNPTNVMGASKRIAELFCQSKDVDGATRFITVRFGNVLGSSGSVVPLFSHQIDAGGPITVTHPDISRYFMTIQEASQLVLHAMQVALSSNESRGRIHVLDMGTPVKISDLAKRMIMLRGLKPEIDIKIKYTGLRPGEKIHEELFSKHERHIASGPDDGILRARLELDLPDLERELDALERAVSSYDEPTALEIVQRTVPEAHLTALGDGKAQADNIVVMKPVRDAARP